MNISFLTSGHDPLDDRIFYHMAKSLSADGNNVEVVSSKINLKTISENIRLDCFAGDDLSKSEKICCFKNRLFDFGPDIIICSEPLPVLAAKKFAGKKQNKIRIIYDITEWYPSKKNLTIYKIPLRWYYFIKLLLFNLLASFLADAFIFGEVYKSKPYRFLFPFKSYVRISYYPDLNYINRLKPQLEDKKLRLCYSGKISFEKGFENYIKVLKRLTESEKDLKLDVKIIGWYETKTDKENCEKLLLTLNQNVTFSFFDRQPFSDFIKLVNNTDIFLDLRSVDFENRRCLPVKLFYFAALGRPVIFSDLKAIRKEVEIKKFGFLVPPSDTELIVSIILNYFEKKDMYYLHCSNALYLSEKKYNWKKIEPDFLNFIHDIFPF
jgi:glycosyltransferase involved in cell wall biosynthesis